MMMKNQLIGTRTTDVGTYMLRKSDAGFYFADFLSSAKAKDLLAYRSHRLYSSSRDELQQTLDSHYNLLISLINKVN